MASRLKIRATTNAIFRRSMQWVDRNRTPKDLSAFSFRASFKASPGIGSVVFTLSTANGGFVDVGLDNGFLEIVIPKAAAPAGTYVFDVLMTTAGEDYLLATGTLIMAAGITS